MKRFYKDVEISKTEGGAYGVCLDTRPVKTPGRSDLAVPTEILAGALADEWRAQTDDISPKDMPMNQYANTAIDRVANARETIIDEIVAYSGSDLLCYRADEPLELVEMQARLWDPILKWFEASNDVSVAITTGVIHVAQVPAVFDAVRSYAKVMDSFELAALNILTTGLGSFFLAAALSSAHLSFDDAWAASQIDEQFQIDRWGEDSQASATRQALREDMNVAYRFLMLARGAPESAGKN